MFLAESLYTGTPAALPIRSYIAMPRGRLTSSPIQIEGVGADVAVEHFIRHGLSAVAEAGQLGVGMDDVDRAL